MKKIKRSFVKIISGALAALMILSLSAVGIFAKSFDDVSEDYAYREQVELLSDIGVILGTGNNSFSPDAPVTREQMALFLFRLMLGRSTAGEQNSTSFDDIGDGIYSGAISWANASDIIIGVSDTKFDPKGGITLRDAFTMLVRALGQASNAMNSGYPWTYIDAAAKLNLDTGLEALDYSKQLTRGEVAALLSNALTAEYLIPRTQNNGSVYFEKSTIIESVFGYELDNGMMTATNTLALENNSEVIKTGYVSFKLDGGDVITVEFSKLGLSGTPESWLGKKVSLIYSVDAKTKAANVLGASYTGKTETVSDVKVSASGSYITVGDRSYKVVETLSDKLSTNANELIVYAYGSGGTLRQIKTTNELSALLGFYSLELISDNRGSDTANRAIIKNFAFGKLDITDGKFEIAGNLTEDELTGGLYNTTDAKAGDYVLYYFNAENKRLEVAEKLNVLSEQLVTKLTDKTATVGGTEFTLGCEKGGVSAESVRQMLKVGAKVNIISRGNIILGVTENIPEAETSEYLVLLSKPVPVYTDNALKYVASANINGKVQNIFVDASDTTANENTVYRFKAVNGVYDLISEKEDGFTLKGDFAQSGSADNDTTLQMNGNPFFTLDGTGFVTDKNSLIIVKNGESFEIVSGIYAGNIVMKSGAGFTAIFTNEIGAVETLRFLFVSNGSLDTAVNATGAVKILAKSGTELIDGKILTVYTVYSFDSGKVETMHSANDSLETGAVYALNASDGLISSKTPASLSFGLVTGFTSSTLTVDGVTYKLGESFKAISIDGTEIKVLPLSSLYMNNIELIASGSRIDGAVLLSPSALEAKFDSDTNAVAISHNIANVGSENVSLTRVTLDGKALEADLSKADISVESGDNGNEIRIACEEFADLKSGKLSLTVTIFGTAFTVETEIVNDSADTGDNGNGGNSGENAE